MDQAKLLISIEDAADACSISVAQIYRMIADGELPYMMIGRRKLIPVDELRAWIVERTRRETAKDVA